jgi:hypothetical protein
MEDGLMGDRIHVPSSLFLAPAGTALPMAEWKDVGLTGSAFGWEYAGFDDFKAFSFDTSREYTFTLEVIPPKTRRQKRDQQRVWGLFFGVRNWRAWKARERRVATLKRRVERRANRRLKP